MTNLQQFLWMIGKSEYSKYNDNGNQIVKMTDAHDNQVSFIFSSTGEYLEFKISI